MIEKLAYGLIIIVHKLCSYFQAHLVQVMTNLPLHYIVIKLDMIEELLR